VTNHPGPCARVRVGKQEVALPAHTIVRALETDGSQPIPRRVGALCEPLRTPQGLVPLIDLALWAPCGVERTHGRRALVLSEGDRTVAVRVDDLKGIAHPAAFSRLHHDDRPEELFQSVVQWRDDGGTAALLEVPRLMALSRLWSEQAHAQHCEGTPKGEDIRHQAQGMGGGAQASVSTRRYAVVSAGDQRWAIDAERLMQATAALPLEFSLRPGQPVRGITSWQGRKLPVVDLAAWGAVHGALPSTVRRDPASAASGSMMVVLGRGDLRVAVLADTVQQLVSLPTPSARGEPLRRAVAAGVGEVTVIDVDALFDQLPEADISRPREPAAQASARTKARTEAADCSSSSYLLFEADATYAAEVTDLVQVVALPPLLQHQLLAHQQASMPFRQESIPVIPLPAYSGGNGGAFGVALVVRLPNGGHAGVAVHRLLSWIGRHAAQPGGLRMASTGQLPIVTVALGGIRQSHIVVNLAEVAQALA